MTAKKHTTKPAQGNLAELVNQIRLALCDESQLIRIAMEKIDDQGASIPLLKSIKSFNNDIFLLTEKLEEFAEASVLKGGG